MTASEDAEIRARLGIPDDATIVHGRLSGMSFGKAYARYQVTIIGVGRIVDGSTMAVDVRRAVASHADTPARAIVETIDGQRRVMLVGLEDDDRPETLKILHRGRKLAQLALARGGRPVDTGQIENDEQIRAAVATVRRNRVRVTRATVATEANVPESALRRYHRERRGMEWREFLASLE